MMENPEIRDDYFKNPAGDRYMLVNPTGTEQTITVAYNQATLETRLNSVRTNNGTIPLWASAYITAQSYSRS